MNLTNHQRLAVIDRMGRIKAHAERPFDQVRVDAYGLVGLSAAVDDLCNQWEELVLDLLDGKATL